MIHWCLNQMFPRSNTIALVVIRIVLIIIILRLHMLILILTIRRGLTFMVYLMVHRSNIILFILILLPEVLQPLLSHLLVCGWLRRTNSSAGYVFGGSEWVMDSGCTNHMTRDKELFTEEKLSQSSQKYITFGDNNNGKVLCLGKVAISKDKHIDKVMLVQSLGYNLRSISKLCDMGMLVLFSASCCVVFSQDDYTFVFEGYRKGDLYIVDFSSGPAVSTCLMAKASSGWLWNRILGHAGMRNLHNLVKKKHVIGLSEVKFNKDRLCSACEAGKITKKHHSAKTIMTTTRPLELLHMDLFGPQNYASLGGNKYGLVIVDDFSRYTWVFFLDDKSKVVKIFKSFAKRAQTEYELSLKHIRSDNGTEFKNTHIEDFHDDHGFTHEFSAAYTPQQNGVVERKNRTLIEMARTMLAEYKTPIRFWAEAINTACHIINKVYLHKFLKKTSHELITGNKPNVSYLRVFGAP